ncbi:hypothetical protein ACFL5L_04095 [candidate division KSB1 bacterium]
MEICFQTTDGATFGFKQNSPFSAFEINLHKEFDKDYPEWNLIPDKKVYRRTSYIYHYNCHGLVFASRRTWIDLTEDVRAIIYCDNYQKVEFKDVLPGDIVLYVDPEGDICHSGIIISKPEDSKSNMPWVLSKWAKYREVVHLLTRCPYPNTEKEYYRIKDESVKPTRVERFSKDIYCF